MLKSNGYDHLIVTGKAPKPKYLLISEEAVRLEDAEDLWGMDTYETTDRLLKKFDPCSVLPIGPAGENLVGISVTLVDKGGTLGSGGFAALMGSKNLKAIVVKMGNFPIKVARRGDLLKLVRHLNKRIMKWPGRDGILKGGIRPTCEAWWGSFHTRTPTELAQEYMSDDGKKAEFELFLRSRKGLACPSCPIGDKECIKAGDIWTYTCQLKQEIKGGVSDPEQDFYLKVKTQHTADRLGVCLHSFTGLVNLLSGLKDQGALSEKDIGVDLKGGGPAMIRLLEMIAQREGIGETLADGVPGLLKTFGEEAEKIAPHNKGRYILWEPRVKKLGTMQMGELTNPRGAHFQAGGSPSYAPGKSLRDFVRHADRMGASPEVVKRVEKEGFNPGRYTKYSEDWFSLFSSVGLCNRAFLNRFYSAGLIADLFSAVTGLSSKAPDLMKAAERGWNLTKLLNLKAGLTIKDDKPPDVWFVPLKGEETHLEICDYFGKPITREDVEKFLQDYYAERGWDDKGRPTAEKLSDLGLKELF
jgi:aldehyde:ferredoxin oxidoreductase